MSTIGLHGLPITQKRSMPSRDDNNNIVFVQGPFGDQYGMPDFNYEQSDTAPARLRRTIDDLLYGQYSRQNFINLFYCLPEISAPVIEIASRVADCVWQLRKNKGEEVIEDDKDFNRLFSTPNPLMSHKQLVFQAVCYELLTGLNVQFFNIPSTLSRDYTNIFTWMNLPSQNVVANKRPGVDPYTATTIEDFVIDYQVGQRHFDPRNTVSVANYDLISGNKVDGYIPQIAGAKLAIRNLIPVYEARGVIYIKRGALGFVVSKKGDASGNISLTPKEKTQLQEDFNESYGLRADKNQINVTSAPVEFVRTSMSIDELKPFDETLADALAIYAVLRVPRHLCPTKDASTFSNADADMKSFYADTIIPLANKYAQIWTTFFGFDLQRKHIYADFSNIPILQENRKENAAVNQIQGNVFLQRFTSGVGTLNEWLVDNGSEKNPNPFYDKYVFDMTPEEVDKVKAIINLKAVSTGTPSQNPNSVEKPAIE